MEMGGQIYEWDDNSDNINGYKWVVVGMHSMHIYLFCILCVYVEWKQGRYYNGIVVAYTVGILI